MSLGDAEVLIMGMGRTGSAAYEYLQHKTHLAALDSDPVLETTEEGFESEVAEADYITEEE